MAGGLRALRVNTVDLLRQPGSRREVATTVPLTDLGVTDDRAAADVGVDLVAESTIDGIVVRGTVTAEWTDECRRCLVPIDRREPVEVDELYQEQASSADAFEIGRDALDLTPLVRDAVSLTLAAPPPLCRDDCAGLCPVCGEDRNQQPCGCDVTVTDDRWAALGDLDLDD